MGIHLKWNSFLVLARYLNLLHCTLRLACVKMAANGARHCKDFEKGRIIGMLEAGLSLSEVARRTQRGKATVHRWWQRYLVSGRCERVKGSGRPRKSTARDDRYLTLLARRERFWTGKRYRQQWFNACNVNCSVRTVYRRLLKSKLRSHKPLVRIPLSPQHRRLRVQWCRDHLGWNNEWQNIMFTDESRFVLDFNDGRVRIRRLPTERFLDCCLVEHDRFGGGSLMIWGGISWNSRTDLVRINGTLTAQRYVNEILEPVVLPAIQQDNGITFQQDNARPHTARLTRTFLGNNNIDCLPWPARSPDLSPIEHLWDNLGRKVYDPELYPLPPATLDELAARLHREWVRIPQTDIQDLLLSMGRRLTECIAKGGGHTRY